MRNILIIFIITVLSTSLIGQTVNKHEVQWGPLLKEKKHTYLLDVIGNDNQGIYILKRGSFKKSNLAVSLLDHNMTPKKTAPIYLGERKQRRSFEYITYINEHLFLFSSKVNKDKKTNEIFVESIDKKSCLQNRDVKKIGEINYDGFNKKNSGNYRFKKSRNESNILVYYNLPYEKKEKEKFGFIVLDKSLNKVWEKKITLPYLEELFEIDRFKVDNDGNVYILGKRFYEKRKTERKGKVNYEIIVLRYDKESDEMKEYPIRLKGKRLNDIQIEINNNQDLICAGFYSNQGTHQVSGSFFLRIDGNSTEIITENHKPFSFELLTQGLTEKKAKKVAKNKEKGKEIGLYEYDLDELIVRDDGGVVLIGEQYYVTVTTHTSRDPNGNTRTYTTYHYHYNNIIVVNINPDGSIAWSKQIQKKQSTTNDSGYSSSYDMAIIKDKLYFTFNDNIKNVGLKNSNQLYYYNKSKKKSVAVIVEMDLSGNQTPRKALFTAKEVEILIQPKLCEQISKNEIILYGSGKKKQRFAKLILN